MRFQNSRLRIVRSAVALVAFSSLTMGLSAQQSSAGAARAVGTIQSISGRSLTVISDTGVSSNVRVEDATRLLQIEPGKTDLKEATPLTFPELQTRSEEHTSELQS